MDIEAMKQAEEEKRKKDEAEKAKKASDAQHGEPDGDEVAKSKKVATEALDQSIAVLEALQKSSADGRYQELLQKAAVKSANKEELQELSRLMLGEDVGPAERVAKSHDTGEPLEKSEKLNLVERVESLRKSHQASIEALGKVLDQTSKANASTVSALVGNQLATSKSLQVLQKSVDTLSARLDKWGQGTDEKPRAVSTAMPGGAGNGTGSKDPAKDAGLSKSKALDLLESMQRESVKSGRLGLTKQGHDLAVVIASVDSNGTRVIDPPLLAEMRDFAKHQLGQ